jgi:hypothetical protein
LCSYPRGLFGCHFRVRFERFQYVPAPFPSRPQVGARVAVKGQDNNITIMLKCG